MKQVYNILDSIEQHFNLNEINTNTVKFGEFDEVNLNKTTLFPLAHFMLEDMRFNGTTIEFKIRVLVADVVDESKDYDNSFKGATNLQDVLNTQASVINRLIESVRGNRGYLAERQYVLKNTPVAKMVYGDYENLLYGWEAEIVIEVPNDISGCEVIDDGIPE